MSNETDPTFLEVLQSINQTGLFEIPDSLQSILIIRSDKQQELAIGRIINNDQEEESDIDEEIDALDKFLLSPFSQIEPYVSYINQKASFDTHQGVKGKEFPRVMLIIDDSEARGFLFSYEKLFGAKEKTKSDFENENSGNDTSIDRTRRLFYVACSRAEKSLAIVAYSENPKKVLEHVINQKWFEQTEVELIEY
jgi:DNA helicase-2/ATP-dependent DNA helicase PcrA